MTECDEKKTDTGMNMISLALSRGVPFGFVLVDSWFMSGKMIRFILSLSGGKHLLGMGKMNGTKYKFKDMDLTPLKAYQLYARRWNIEVFKETRQFFGLNDCHSRDFDALIAHTSVSLIAYNMFSTTQRLNSYETLGDLFREVAGQMTELTLSERIWAVIEEILNFVADLFEIDFAFLIQSLMQKGDPESKLLRIVNFSNARAA